jgi:hypothetical protein
MNDAELREIEARHGRLTYFAQQHPRLDVRRFVGEDAPALLAEVRRLRAVVQAAAALDLVLDEVGTGQLPIRPQYAALRAALQELREEREALSPTRLRSG